MKKTTCKSVKEVLETLQGILLNESDLIVKMIKDKKANPLELFDVKAFGESNCNSMVTNTDAGIYVFMLATTVQVNPQSGLKFNDIEFGAKTNKNLSGGQFLKDNCFYLGKAENKMLKRIEEHLDSKNKTTYSLKLNELARQHVKKHLCIYTFAIKDCYKEFRKDILCIIEKHLHNKLKPLVGTKRS